MNNSTRTIFFLALLLITTLAAPGSARAVELGLTPSPVFGLWTNINKALIVYARARSTNEDWLNQLAQMTPEKFSGKDSATVLEMVKTFAARLNELDVRRPDKTTDKLLGSDLQHLLANDQGRVTPSMVYLHSGQVLINVAEDILRASSVPVEVSPFFEERNVADKTPSDVFGLIDLGLRRLVKILTLQHTGQLTPITGAR
ncbi:MAG: hypothetical protein HQ494_13030 [Rhodospirillales bacterium]|nr:hypothetical protein [Rhodospirillales bacterium]